MYPQSKRDEYFAKQNQLADALLHKDALLKAKEAIEKDLAAIPSRTREASEHMRRSQLVASLKDIEQGADVGYYIGPLALVPRVGKLGIYETEILIVRLERECADLHEHVSRWPTPDTRHAFRYKGRPDKVSFDGRYLVPGEVVEMNETRATALADMFEPA